MSCLEDQLGSGVVEGPESGGDCGDLVGREIEI
jgi:hypothetical protein